MNFIFTSVYCLKDDLSHVLRNNLHGCYVNGECFNHVVLADDTLLLAPSHLALRNLIYTFSDCLVTNHKISKCMAICLKFCKDQGIPKLLQMVLYHQISKKKGLLVLLSCCDDENDTLFKQTRALYAQGK